MPVPKDKDLSELQAQEEAIKRGENPPPPGYVVGDTEAQRQQLTAEEAALRAQVAVQGEDLDSPEARADQARRAREALGRTGPTGPTGSTSSTSSTSSTTTTSGPTGSNR